MAPLKTPAAIRAKGGIAGFTLVANNGV